MPIGDEAPGRLTVRPYTGEAGDGKHTYFPIPSSFLRPKHVLNFDVYRRTSTNTLEVFLRKGVSPTSLFPEQGGPDQLDNLYVRADQRDALIDHEEEVLLEVLDDPLVPMDGKCSAIQHVATSLTQEMFRDPSAVNISRQKRNVFRLVDFTMRDKTAVQRLVSLAHHDYYTYTHSVNVGLYGLAVATHLGSQVQNDLHELVAAFFLHDIGKCLVSASVINKFGPLNEAEWAEMKKHPAYGVAILTREHMINEVARVVVLEHHERVDGKGYPNGIRRGEIHPYARMCSIIDAFDALTTNRSYRKGHTPFQALQIMREEFDMQFDPAFYKAFVLQLQKGRQRAQAVQLESEH